MSFVKFVFGYVPFLFPFPFSVFLSASSVLSVVRSMPKEAFFAADLQGDCGIWTNFSNYKFYSNCAKFYFSVNSNGQFDDKRNGVSPYLRLILNGESLKFGFLDRRKPVFEREIFSIRKVSAPEVCFCGRAHKNRSSFGRKRNDEKEIE